ncbi:MAG TPA: hypothetical protein VNO14_13110 [Blastocatellia bacterium]|nr:hypothetical protein [Blastocatellia bacterium]
MGGLKGVRGRYTFFNQFPISITIFSITRFSYSILIPEMLRAVAIDVYALIGSSLAGFNGDRSEWIEDYIQPE